MYFMQKSDFDILYFPNNFRGIEITYPLDSTSCFEKLEYFDEIFH